MRGLNNTKGKARIQANAARIHDDSVASRTRLAKKRSRDEDQDTMPDEIQHSQDLPSPKRVQFDSPYSSADEDEDIQDAPEQPVREPTPFPEGETVDPIDIDSEDDTDYVPSDTEETYNYFAPSKSSMDKELTNLAKAENDYNDQQMARFLDEEYDEIDSDSHSIQESIDIPEEINSSLQTDPIQPIIEDIIPSNNDDEVIEPSLEAVQKILQPDAEKLDIKHQENVSHVLDRPLRKKRVSKYDEPDRNAAFDSMFEHNVEVRLPLSKMLGLIPTFRKRLHEATRTQLMDREGPINSTPKYEVNMTQLINCTDPQLVQSLIRLSARSGKKEITLLYDSGSQANLINEKTLKGLRYQKFKLKENVQITGIHNTPKLITHAVQMKITIEGIHLAVTMFIDDGITEGEILIGLPFQMQYKFWIGFNEHDEQVLGFKHGQNRYQFPLLRVRVIQPTVIKLYVSDVSTKDKLREELAKCVENALISNNMTKYFVYQALHNHREVFFQEGGSTGRLNLDVHPPVKIRLKEHTPWRAKTIPLGPRREAAVKILSDMVDNQQLEYSDANYRNPWFLIPKKDGSFRMLTDLRELNKHVELEGGHPYSTEDLTSELAGRAFNTLIDVKNAYFQVPLDSTTNDATSFLTPLGLLKYSVLPQGYINSVSEFSNILQKVLKPVAVDVVSFIDDIAIKGPLVDDLINDPSLGRKHVEKVLEVLKLLKEAGLKINPAKLKFAVPECDFLGYHITPKGKTLIQNQVAALLNYPMPFTKKRMESFLGLVNYYRGLLPAFAELTGPLYQLATEATPETKYKILWTNEARKCFNMIIKALTQAPVLAPINFNQTISLHCDASEMSWAGVLQITDSKGVSRMVQCLSGKFQGSQRRYSIYEKELMSIYNTLMAVHSTLVGYQGVLHIYCDNKAITQVLNAPLTNSHYVSRLYKWLNFIRTFNYEIHHVAGKDNVIADALTRCHSDDSTPKMSYAVNELVNEFKSALPIQSNYSTVSGNSTPKYKNFSLDAIKEYHKSLTIPPEYQSRRRLFIYRAHEFYSEGDLLFKIGKDGSHSKRVIYDNDLIKYLFESVHDKRGHPKLPTMMSFLSSRYYIPNLYQKLKDYLQSCPTCQKFGPSNERLPLFLHLPVGVLHTVVIDTVFIHDKYLVVARDEFSGWVEARATSKLSGEFVAKFLYEDWLCRYGHFANLKSDNGKEYVNKEVKDLLERFNIRHVSTIPFNPQSNGMAERGHRSILNFIRSLPNPAKWEEHLSTILWVDRSTPKTRTGYTPQFLMFGFEGVGNPDILQSSFRDDVKYTPQQLLKGRYKQLSAKNFETRIAKSTQYRQKKKYKAGYDNRYETTKKLRVGDLVLAKSPLTKDDKVPIDKISPRWSGPYRIVSIDEQWYKLQSLEGIPIATTYTRGMLKKFFQRKQQKSIKRPMNNSKVQNIK